MIVVTADQGLLNQKPEATCKWLDYLNSSVPKL